MILHYFKLTVFFYLLQTNLYYKLQTHINLFFQSCNCIINLVFLYNNKIKNMSQQIQSHDRDISSSEDNCRCQCCRNQEELKNYQRQNPTNIYMFKHLKKRGVPPIKKQCGIKQLSLKARNITKKQQYQRKVETQKSPANPPKQKLSDVLKWKQNQGTSTFIEYHPVSHSQREKVPSKDSIPVVTEHRRVINLQDLKSNAFNKQLRPKVASLRLVQISQNPENIRLRYHHQSRSLSQASAGCNEQIEVQIRSLEKIKN